MMQTLVSVPPGLRDYIEASSQRKQAWRSRIAGSSSARLFFGADPIGTKLGSGGGTANLLVEAWRQESPTKRRRSELIEWLGQQQTLVLHAGGESRRLPAYASIGKAFIPIPHVKGLDHARFDQRLSDLQISSYQAVMMESGSKPAVMVTSGDVWLRFDPVQIPRVSADIAGIGMRVSPEIAQHFGVYFVKKNSGRSATGEHEISFFLQKPSTREIYRHLSTYDFFVDTGMWLLSLEAIQVVLRRCGWNAETQSFSTESGHAAYLDMYTELGAALGTRGTTSTELKRAGWKQLSSSVIPLEEANFYHLGSSRQLFESFEQIQRGQFAPRRSLAAATRSDAYHRQSNAPVWIDGVSATVPLQLQGSNVITGIPARAQVVRFATDWCLEIAPTDHDKYIFRPYHLDDSLRGVPSASALICGQNAKTWLAARQFQLGERDVFELPIYPVLHEEQITQALLEWYFAEQPDPSVTSQVIALPRIAAREIPQATDLERLFTSRDVGYEAALHADFNACLKNGEADLFEQDFCAIAKFCQDRAPRLRAWLVRHHQEILRKVSNPVHRSRLLMLFSELQSARKREVFADAGRRCLQSALISSNRIAKVRPHMALKEDQIVWGRSPVRLDLGGGWTDTPPYCLEYGGAVLNVAVLLNRQPPIQTFIRRIPELTFRLRSIDLGSAEEVTTFEALAGYSDPRSGFSLPKAALALAGFHPDFFAGRAYSSLRQHLKAAGGGLEISLLSAVPKGSGLGTSSILGATLLGALNRACAIGWDEVDLYNRVLGIEQLLTTGGGWQDQAGALFRGLKLIQTPPGASQTPTVRFLPEHLLGVDHANRTLLLYYTGITRLAKGILKEIVQNMFLAESHTLRTLGQIRANAVQLHHALQEGSLSSLHRCIGRSWILNKQLDAGTTTPAIERIIATCEEDLTAAKLLGAGGGGYMLLCAATPEAGQRIRQRLEAQPPNPRARFIDFQVSDQALEVTVS